MRISVVGQICPQCTAVHYRHVFLTKLWRGQRRGELCDGCYFTEVSTKKANKP